MKTNYKLLFTLGLTLAAIPLISQQSNAGPAPSVSPTPDPSETALPSPSPSPTPDPTATPTPNPTASMFRCCGRIYQIQSCRKTPTQQPPPHPGNDPDGNNRYNWDPGFSTDGGNTNGSTANRRGYKEVETSNWPDQPNVSRPVAVRPIPQYEECQQNWTNSGTPGFDTVDGYDCDGLSFIEYKVWQSEKDIGIYSNSPNDPQTTCEIKWNEFNGEPDVGDEN